MPWTTCGHAFTPPAVCGAFGAGACQACGTSVARSLSCTAPQARWLSTGLSSLWGEQRPHAPGAGAGAAAGSAPRGGTVPRAAPGEQRM